MQSIQHGRLVGRPDILCRRFQRTGSQREEGHHFEQGETTALLLGSMLGIGRLIGRRVGQQHGGAIGQKNAPSPPSTRRFDAVFQPVSHLAGVTP